MRIAENYMISYWLAGTLGIINKSFFEFPQTDCVHNLPTISHTSDNIGEEE